MFQRSLKTSLLIATMMVVLNCFAWAEEAAKPAAAAPAEAAAAPEAAKPAESPATLPAPRVKMTTSLGEIVLELDAEKAPITVLNFLEYADSGFYNGTIFHRVMKDFMIQGGGYTPDMEEKSGKRPPIRNEWRNGLKNTRGTIAMARLGGQADSATAQFFINVVDNDGLDKPRDGAAYAVFGKVVEGMEVVDAIRNTEVIRHPKYPSSDAVTPKEPVVIQSVTLLTPFDREVLKAKVTAAEEAEKRAKEEAEKAKVKLLEDYLKKAEAEHGKTFTQTASGLKYMIIKEGAGAQPKPTDRVKVHYKGFFPDGKEFDSSIKRGVPAEFPLNGVIRGWTEGVGYIKAGGGKDNLVCPPDLAYGPGGRPGIPPNSTLIFEVELLEILK